MATPITNQPSPSQYKVEKITHELNRTGGDMVMNATFGAIVGAICCAMFGGNVVTNMLTGACVGCLSTSKTKQTVKTIFKRTANVVSRPEVQLPTQKDVPVAPGVVSGPEGDEQSSEPAGSEGRDRTEFTSNTR